MIDRDINRTYPNHEDYITMNGMGQETLRRVLYAFADHDKEVQCGFFQFLLDQIYPGHELHCWSFPKLYDGGRCLLGSPSNHGKHTLSNEQVVQSGTDNGSYQSLPGIFVVYIITYRWKSYLKSIYLPYRLILLN